MEILFKQLKTKIIKLFLLRSTARKASKYRAFSGLYFPYLDWIRENTDQKNSVFGLFSRRESSIIDAWQSQNVWNRDLLRYLLFSEIKLALNE